MKMRKLLAGAYLTLAVTACFSATTFAAIEYEFRSGTEVTTIFGKPTAYEEPVPLAPETENVRRNKDAAFFAPPYGIFSGDIPTDRTSLYHDNGRSGGSAGSSGGSIGATYGVSPYSGNSYLDGTGTSINGTSIVEISIKEYGLLPTNSVYEGPTYLTEPLYDEDGSIGILRIPRLGKTLKVYQGESLENMKKGIGHFEHTSAWDGNVAFAGHNRGATPYFSFVKYLEKGDTITYTTLYGTRTYSVYSKTKISETDYSGLTWSSENIITLITCVEDQPTMRWLVQAREMVKASER